MSPGYLCITLKIIIFVSVLTDVYQERVTLVSPQNMEKTDGEITERAFVVRSYGKGELASMYIGGVQQQTAVKQFNEWIRAAPGLEQRLRETGMAPSARRYTPAQVRLIVGVLGTP